MAQGGNGIIRLTSRVLQAGSAIQGSAAAAAGTAESQMSRLAQEIRDLRKEIGQQFVEEFLAIIRALREMVKWLGENIGLLEKLAQVALMVGGVLATYKIVTGIMAITKAVQGLTAAMAAGRLAMLGNPMALLVTGVAVSGAIIYKQYTDMQERSRVVAALGVTALAALLLAVPLFRLHGDYFAFASLALLPLLEVLAYNLTPITRGADGIVLPVAQVLKPAYLIALAVCVITFAVTLRIHGARFGYALKSIRNDEQVAETVGVRIAPVKRRVLVLSGVFGAAAGALQAWQMSYIDPATVFGLNVALAPIAMVLFAGSGLRYGPLVGVLLLASMQQWLLVSVKGFQATLYGATLLLIGRFMPGGFLRAKWVRRIPGLAEFGREHHEHAAASAMQAPAQAAGELPLPTLQVAGARPLIELQGVRMQFGGNVAVNDVNLSIRAGEIVGLIGPNGSGKTTLFNCISRVYTPTAGRVLFDGQDLAGLGRDGIARLGVGRTYQIPRPFSDLTVQENIAIPLMFGANPLSPRDALREAEASQELVLCDSELHVTLDLGSSLRRALLSSRRRKRSWLVEGSSRCCGRCG